MLENLEAVELRRSVAKTGPRHGEQRFQRSGTGTCTAVTTAGEDKYDFHSVEDTAADHDEPSYFRSV